MLIDSAARFAPIGLAEIGEAALMQRVDRKFLVPVDRLETLLASCEQSYRILDIGGVRISRYSTGYFDTPELGLYNAHHSGRATRAKVRTREYVDSGRTFLEVKRRANTGRTYKSRIAFDGNTEQAFRALRALPDFAATGIASDAELHPVVRVLYSRLTLVHRTAPERITVDVNVELTDGAQSVVYPTVVFAEVKQVKKGPSPFIDALEAIDVREGSISKYCLGVVSLIDHARKHRFKRALARLHDTGIPRVHRHSA